MFGLFGYVKGGNGKKPPPRAAWLWSPREKKAPLLWSVVRNRIQMPSPGSSVGPELFLSHHMDVTPCYEMNKWPLGAVAYGCEMTCRTAPSLLQRWNQYWALSPVQISAAPHSSQRSHGPPDFQVCLAMVPCHSTLTGRAEGWVGLSRALLRGPHSQAFLIRPQDIRVVKGDRFPPGPSMCAGVCVQGARF